MIEKPPVRMKCPRFVCKLSGRSIISDSVLVQ